jgi:hypothetical protein
MGGRGSGPRPSFPTTLEGFQAVDLRYLWQQGLLEPGHWGSLRWSRAGRETGSIRFVVGEDTVTLAYRVRDGGSRDWTDITEPVRLLRTAQPFGGERLWFACPRCGRRCAVLYGGRRFFCRRCVGVPYASQNEAVHERLLRRVQDMRERLGGCLYVSLDAPFPPKPKRMRWTTYRRLQAKGRHLEWAMSAAAAKRFGTTPEELDKLL